jgi:hypothetical protein
MKDQQFNPKKVLRADVFLFVLVPVLLVLLALLASYSEHRKKMDDGVKIEAKK